MTLVDVCRRATHFGTGCTNQTARIRVELSVPQKSTLSSMASEGQTP